MKRLFCIFTTCLLIVSCSSEEKESVYNADLELNAPILMNKKVISQEITLEEISSYYGDEQKAIFRALTPENRKRLWKEKFDKLLILTTDTNEKALLNRIYDEVKQMDFNESLENDDEEILLLKSLVAEGVSMFGWDDVYVDITFSSFEFYQAGKRNYNIYFLTAYNDDASGGGGTVDCTCRWSAGCLGMDCVDGKFDCKETDFGCGLIWFQGCTGLCW